ncbi:MAG: methyltransferase domain-containing protein [Planctomycetaceae bacterium]|nr:methyltransferase domain-containing protein [Planctomycetaceae bacterium]
MTHNSADIPEELLLGQFIPLHYHFNMLRDQTRMIPFKEAIELAVPLNGTVLELGGGTGVLSWFAAQRARKVWCIERNPALVRAAASFLAQNHNGDRVTVVQADAMTYLPPEPVDVVVCEMLHVGLVREKQLDVIRNFKERYRRKFGNLLPSFIPDTSMLAVMPISQDFCFSGYRAAVPMFEPVGPQTKEASLADPHYYATVEYGVEFPGEFDVQVQMAIQKSGCFNAVGLLTNNFLAFVLSEGRAVQWLMNQLILPLPEPVNVAIGDCVSIQFQYRAGCPIEELQESIRAEIVAQTRSSSVDSALRRAA